MSEVANPPDSLPAETTKTVTKVENPEIAATADEAQPLTKSEPVQNVNLPTTTTDVAAPLLATTTIAAGALETVAAAAAAAAQSQLQLQPVKRGRGRGRKITVTMEGFEQSVDFAAREEDKQKLAAPVDSTTLATASAAPQERKTVGRKRKRAEDVDINSVESTTAVTLPAIKIEQDDTNVSGKDVSLSPGTGTGTAASSGDGGKRMRRSVRLGNRNDSNAPPSGSGKHLVNLSLFYKKL